MEWIKMRGELLSHPKVVAIARHLRGDPAFQQWLLPASQPSFVAGPPFTMAGEPERFAVSLDQAPRHDAVTDAALLRVTVGALLMFWSSARAHGKFDGVDLRLEHSTILDVDQMAGCPGLGAAMSKVGWLTNGDGLTLKNFKEFNVPKSDAERAADYRGRAKSDPPDEPERTVTKPSRTTRDKRVTREEKSRREESGVSGSTGNTGGGTTPPPPAKLSGTLPDWMPSEVWRLWWSCRPARTRTATAHAAALQRLEKWRGEGVDVVEVVRTSGTNGWQGLFDPRERRTGAGGGGKQAAIESGNRTAAEEWLSGGAAPKERAA